MTTPEDQQTFHAAAKPVLIMALVVAAMLAVIAVIVGVAAFWSLEFDFDLSDLDLSELKLIDYSHPYFSPAEGEEETYPWVSAMLLLNMPETVFVVEPGESHEAAARRLMPICR